MTPGAPLVARINFHPADELVDSWRTRPLTTTISRAGVVDPRHQGGGPGSPSAIRATATSPDRIDELARESAENLAPGDMLDQLA